MATEENLLEQLETALVGKSVAKRAELLKRVTDLFVSAHGRANEVQSELLDEVLVKLVRSVDLAAKAKFGSTIARLSDAPPKTLRVLAFDPNIDVAGDVLCCSERLSEADLLENARTMSQQHLLAISKRRELKEGLTDVLVTRGDREVLISTATNKGSRFSEGGLARLINRSEKDADLTLSIWSRNDIPRREMVLLFRQASEGLRLQMEAAHPRQSSDVRAAIAAATDELLASARSSSQKHLQAQVHVSGLHADGLLDEEAVLSFLKHNNFDALAFSLALMCELPLGLSERILAQGREEQLLLIGKALSFKWTTTLELLAFQAGGVYPTQADCDRLFASFSRMKTVTARLALEFYRKREAAGA